MQTQIEYQIRSSSKARHIRISVYRDGKVVVTKPARVPSEEAFQFVSRKSSWIRKKLNYYKNRNVVSLGIPDSVEKSHALEFVKSRINFYNQHYRLPFGNIAIKDHKSLWGSCSVRKNLNFNDRITQLPQNQADYIIVHELCHLVYMNHSQKFWDLVAETIPDHKRIRKELKNYSFI